METQLIDVKADIRERLLQVAIRLFAEKGIDAVSMRAINTAAGSKNKSAVHYHFGSKLGIIEAIFAMLSQRFMPDFEQLLDQIERRAETEDIAIAESVMVFCLPFFILSQRESYGPHVIKFLAKLMLDSTPEYQELFNNHFKQHMERVYRLIKAKAPNKDDQHLRFQLMHGLMAVITGMATVDLMGNTLLGDIRFDDDLSMAMSYVDYAAGGLSNETNSTDKIDIEFWQSYFNNSKTY